MNKYFVIQSGMYLIKTKNKAGIISSVFTDNAKDAKQFTLKTAKKHADTLRASVYKIVSELKLEKVYYK